MPRVKGGYTTRRRHKKVLRLAKGYVGSKHTIYKTAHEQVMRSLAYAYRDRKAKKRDFRRLWITRINAAVRERGLSYSKFMDMIHKANIDLDRKVLAYLAVEDPQAFDRIIEAAKAN